MLEDIELDRESLTGIHVLGILSTPAEGSAPLNDLETGKIDISLPQEINIAFREVIADDPDQPHLRKVTGCELKINSRPAQGILDLPVGSANRIAGNGTDNEQRHGETSAMKRSYNTPPWHG